MFKKFIILYLIVSSFLSLELMGIESSQIQEKFRHCRHDLVVSKKHQFIWFPVYKAGSTSIRYHLFEHDPDLIILPRSSEIPKEFQGYFKFAFVRNPWDRILSCYLQKIVTQRYNPLKACFGQNFDFFVDYINLLDVNQSSTNPHIQSQINLIPINQLDFIGKLENFDDDFKLVCDVIGIPCNHSLHKNQTEHDPYWNYYTPRTRDIIAKKYREDIETFGYTFAE